MNFIIKKTPELSEQEIELFCSLFGIAFPGQHKSPTMFKDLYLNTALGYSYHALMYFEDELVGAHNEIPMHYTINEKKVIFCVGADVMIKEGFRSLPNLNQLIKLIDKAIKDDGINFIFGFPNENAHLIMNRIFKYRDIGTLKTYILPYRIGGIIRKLKFLNPMTIILAKIFTNLSKLRTKSKPVSFVIDKNREAQTHYRFKWVGGDYKICQLNDFNFVYRIFTKDGVRTAFLIDIDKVSSLNLSAAVRYIMKMDNKKFDLIMYVGYLPFNAFPLFKIPKRFEPKKFNFHGKFLDAKNADENFFEIKNWNVNLSCYDLV